MITVKEFPDKQFSTKEELFKALRENKTTLISAKKTITKHADAIIYHIGVENSKGETVKADTDTVTDTKNIKAELVINTTNILDSHNDVHLKGIWKKSVKEKKNTLLLQEHKMTFDHIISDDVDQSVKLF